jgi:hypothetical protein
MIYLMDPHNVNPFAPLKNLLKLILVDRTRESILRSVFNLMSSNIPVLIFCDENTLSLFNTTFSYLRRRLELERREAGDNLSSPKATRALEANPSEN